MEWGRRGINKRERERQKGMLGRSILLRDGTREKIHEMPVSFPCSLIVNCPRLEYYLLYFPLRTRGLETIQLNSLQFSEYTAIPKLQPSPAQPSLTQPNPKLAACRIDLLMLKQSKSKSK